MTQQAEIFDRIDKIPPQYLGEVIDFLGYIQHKVQQKAKNNENEKESCYWNTEPLQSKMKIPVNNEGKFILTKEVIEEMERNSPITQRLSGILSGIGDIDLDEIRMARLAKHL